MKLPEHIALSILLAQFGVQQHYGLAGTAMIAVAGVLPDLDGLGIVFGWRFYQRHHRILGHGLPVTLLGPPLLALAAVGLFDADFGTMWLWCQVALVSHLLTDGLFYRWPVQLLWPISSHGWGVGLLGWNDLVPTVILYGTAAVALLWPAVGPAAALSGILGLATYLCWRSLRPADRSGWSGWLAGQWTVGTPRFYRWLTGDFIH